MKFNVAPFAVSFLLLLGAEATKAQDPPGVDAFVKSLSRQPLTRSISEQNHPQMSLQEASVLASVVNAGTRSISSRGRKNLDEFLQKLPMPSIDLEINFPLNSDRLDQNSKLIATQLAAALLSEALKDQSFVVAGHTDARGLADMNQRLSERRAETVKAFLVEKFSINPDRLVTAGYGKEKLKNSRDPYADENRRVQIINLGQIAKKNPESSYIEKSSDGESTPDPLAALDGTWLSLNPPGPAITFFRTSFGQRHAILPIGQAAVRISDGASGSNLKVAGEGFECFYYVGFASMSEMIWQLKEGNSACPNSGYFKRSIN